MDLREVLSGRFGEHITLTVAPEAFTFEGSGIAMRVPTVIQMSEREGKPVAIGDSVPDPVVPGPVISLFDGPRTTPEWGWPNERYCVLFCRYHLMLLNDGFRYLLKPLGVRPQIDVLGASSLRRVLGGQERVVLDRVLRAAGAGAVRFLETRRQPNAPTSSPAA